MCVSVYVNMWVPLWSRDIESLEGKLQVAVTHIYHGCWKPYLGSLKNSGAISPVLLYETNTQVCLFCVSVTGQFASISSLLVPVMVLVVMLGG